MRLILSLLLLTISISIAGAAQPATSPTAAEIAKRQEMLKIAADLKESINKNPKNVELYVQLGFIYSKLKNINEAQNAFETAAKLNPKHSKAHFMLGLIYEKKGMKNKAIAAWQICLDNTLKKRIRKKAIKHLHFLRAQ
jgi:cytochrome c-type biogenesis protein CcmH/NrfG